MFTIQQAIISLVDTNKTEYISNVKTIKEYAGELKDVAKLNVQIPAVYVMPIESVPLANEPQHQVDLLIVTKSDSFDKEGNKNINMQMSENVVELIAANKGFNYNDVPFVFDTERLSARLAMLDNKYAIVILKCYLLEGYE